MRVLIVTSLSEIFSEYSYYHDWQAGFVNHPNLETDVLDIQSTGTTLRGVALRGRYDLIAFLHNTHPTLTDSPRLGMLRTLLMRVRGKRVFFLNNEYRTLKQKCDMAEYLGARTLVSQLNRDDAEMLYRTLWTHHILSLPYGFDASIFKPDKPHSERQIDIGFRGDYYPPYVGHDDRDLLLDDFNKLVKKRKNVRTDIQVGQRFDRLGWAAFLNNCMSLIGHEAGSTRLDYDENIRLFLNAQGKRLTPDNFRKLVLTMRQTGVFDAPPSGRIAAPRNYEAMGTKTVQILLPGRYNDTLEAGVHYIELKRDFSNLDQVIDTLFDPAAFAKIADRAYEDGLKYHTYEQRVDRLLTEVLG